jgi:hypothetical protein
LSVLYKFVPYTFSFLLLLNLYISFLFVNFLYKILFLLHILKFVVIVNCAVVFDYFYTFLFFLLMNYSGGVYRWGVLDANYVGTPVSSTNKTDRQDITEILLKVVLNTIILTPLYLWICFIRNYLFNIYFFLHILKFVVTVNFAVIFDYIYTFLLLNLFYYEIFIQYVIF